MYSGSAEIENFYQKYIKYYYYYLLISNSISITFNLPANLLSYQEALDILIPRLYNIKDESYDIIQSLKSLDDDKRGEISYDLFVKLMRMLLKITPEVFIFIYLFINRIVSNYACL